MSKGSSSEFVPFGDPGWLQGQASPYYKETHRQFQKKVRAFFDANVVPYVSDWEESGHYPHDLHKRAYEFGPEWMRQEVAVPVIKGEKFLALAITEPWAGSDVGGIQTTAVRDGDHYVVNGQKKFITSGTFADFLVTAVRTGGAGMGGISVLLIPRTSPGVKTRRIPTQGWAASETAHITFEDVRVPVKNLIGAENQGFKVIMFNFNHERLIGCYMAARSSRVCIEESIKYARLRKTFGKRLLDHQVIRHKLADMIRQVDATHSQLENLTYQLAAGQSGDLLGGQIALLKVQCTQVMEFCAREALQIFGGNGVLRTGHGEKVERIYRDVRISAIGGGSEEILRDLAIRQARL